MKDITLKEMIEAGIHFGSPTARWDPRMAPYIHGKKSGIHIINLRETVKGLIRAQHFIKKIVQNGKRVLFVGTKRQAAPIVRAEAVRSKSFFVASRWLGGTLTNKDTMRQRIKRLQELENLETSGKLHSFSKKMISSLTREHKKVARNFEGIRDMTDLPGALVIVDPNEEHIAMHEAMKLDIPTIALVDTDSDPSDVDFIIPANDDSQRSINYLLERLSDAVIEASGQARTNAAMAARAADKPAEAAEEDPGIAVPENLSEMGGFSFGGDE